MRRRTLRPESLTAQRTTKLPGPAKGTGEPDGTGTGDRAGTSASAAAGNGADGPQNVDVPEDADAGRAADADGAGSAPLGDEVTIVPGVARYCARRGCILIRFLSDGDLETMTRREAEATGSVACKACQPDEPDSSA